MSRRYVGNSDAVSTIALLNPKAPTVSTTYCVMDSISFVIIFKDYKIYIKKTKKVTLYFFNAQFNYHVVYRCGFYI